jgi:hypothetical protein
MVFLLDKPRCRVLEKLIVVKKDPEMFALLDS